MKYNFDEVIDRIGTSSYKWDYRKQYFGVENVLPMWVADMDFKAAPFIINALKKRLEHGIFGYTFRPESFYQSIVEWIYGRHNWKIQKEWICFSPGIVPALNLAVMAYTNPGDKIIVQTPVYYPFFSTVKNHNRILINNPLTLKNGRYRMDYHDLEKKIDKQTKMIILCSPHNPTGNVWKKEELKNLTEICVQHNLLIISDEIHSDLIYKGYKHIPTASLSHDIAQRIVTCISPSKTFNLAGLSTSAIITSNEKLYQKFEKILDQVHVGEGNIFGFAALEAAYNNGEEWLKQLLVYLDSNIQFLVEFLKNNIPQIKPIVPEATYLVWLDCRELNMSDKKLKDWFLNRAKLGLSPGYIFGKEGKGFQRINIGCSRKTLSNALNQLKLAIESDF